MTITNLRDAAQTAYEPFAKERRQNRLDIEHLQEQRTAQYQQEQDMLEGLLHSALELEDHVYEIYPEGVAYPGFVPPKPVARTEGLLFFVLMDESTDLPLLMMSFDDEYRFRYQAEVYSLADIGEAIEAYSEFAPGKDR